MTRSKGGPFAYGSFVARQFCLRAFRPLLVGILLSPLQGFAAETSLFSFGLTTLTLRDDSNQVSVRYQSMRLNRSLDVWNADVVIENTGSRPLHGPFVLRVQSFTGTTGPLLTDGSSGAPPKGFFDLSGGVPDGVLSPGEKTLPRTITFGRAVGVPQLVTKFFSWA